MEDLQHTVLLDRALRGEMRLQNVNDLDQVFVWQQWRLAAQLRRLHDDSVVGIPDLAVDVVDEILYFGWIVVDVLGDLP